MKEQDIIKTDIGRVIIGWNVHNSKTGDTLKIFSAKSRRAAVNFIKKVEIKYDMPDDTFLISPIYQ